MFQAGLDYIMCFKAAWVVWCIPGRPGLHSKILPQKAENKQKQAKQKSSRRSQTHQKLQIMGVFVHSLGTARSPEGPCGGRFGRPLLCAYLAQSVTTKGGQDSSNNTFSFLTRREVGEAKLGCWWIWYNSLLWFADGHILVVASHDWRRESPG